MLIQCIW